MKRIMHFALSCCICLPAAQAQEDYRRLFATDPYGSDGYFIPDRRAMANLGIDHIIIDLFAARLNSSNELVIRTFDQVTIQPGQTYGKFDLSKLGTLGSGEQVHYEATGYGSNNSVVITFAATRPGGWAWPAVCYYTCEAASYAYTLTVHSSDFQHYIEITNGTDDGDPFYFYVLASDFQEFRYQFTPSDLGIYGGNWDVILSNTEQDDVIRMIGVPAGARDYYG